MTAALLPREEAIGAVMPKPLLKCLQIVMIILFSFGRDAWQLSSKRLFLTWSLNQGRLTYNFRFAGSVYVRRYVAVSVPFSCGILKCTCLKLAAEDV